MENVLTREVDCWHIKATTALESIPPERKAPSGTSDIRRTRTASCKSWMLRSAASSSLMLVLLAKFKDQYCSMLTSPSCQISRQPGSSFCTPRKAVIGPGTHMKDRY